MSQRYFEDVHHAALYAKFRPNAPPQLAKRIIEFLREKYQGELELCCDVGCGNGQCSGLFSDTFRKVLATDISPAQVEVAKTLKYPENIEFQSSPAEKSPAENSSAQIVVACVAAHWFDLPAFFKETDRILCQDGVVAITSYFLPIAIHPEESADALNQALKHIFCQSLGPYFGSGVRHVENEYADFTIPYKDNVREYVWTDEEPCTLAGLVSDIETWSGYQNLCKTKGDSAGRELLEQFIASCQSSLKTTEEPDKINLVFKRKYFLLMGRKM